MQALYSNLQQTSTNVNYYATECWQKQRLNRLKFLKMWVCISNKKKQLSNWMKYENNFLKLSANKIAKGGNH